MKKITAIALLLCTFAFYETQINEYVNKQEIYEVVGETVHEIAQGFVNEEEMVNTETEINTFLAHFSDFGQSVSVKGEV